MDAKKAQERAMSVVARSMKLRRELDIENRRLQKRASIVHDRMIEQSKRLRDKIDPESPDDDSSRAYQLASSKRASAQQVMGVLKQIQPTLAGSGPSKFKK